MSKPIVPPPTEIKLVGFAPPSEFSEQFLRGMVNRMSVSFHKYGSVADAYPEKLNALASMQARLDLYRATGNTEYLIDAANFLMIEFMRPSVDHAFFEATDSDGSPGRVDASGETTHAPNGDV